MLWEIKAAGMITTTSPAEFQLVYKNMGLALYTSRHGKKVKEKKQIQSLLYAINYIQHQNYLCTWVGVSDGGFQQPTVVFCRIRWDDLHARHLAVPCTKTLRMLSTYACGGTIGPTEYNRYRYLRGFRQINVDIKAQKWVLWLVTVSPLLIWKLGTTVSIYSCAAKFFAHFFFFWPRFCLCFMISAFLGSHSQD